MLDIHNLHKKLHHKLQSNKLGSNMVQLCQALGLSRGLHRFSRWIHIGICSVQLVNICEEENPFRFQLYRRQRCQVVVVAEAHAVLIFFWQVSTVIAPNCAEKCHDNWGIN